jgi:hypothetical protein
MRNFGTAGRLRVRQTSEYGGRVPRHTPDRSAERLQGPLTTPRNGALQAPQTLPEARGGLSLQPKGSAGCDEP